MSATGATLSGSYSGASASPTAVGFKYGTVSGSLNQTVSASDNNGSLSATLSGLTAGTTYYYKAYVTVYGTGDYASQSQTFEGSEYSFTTASSQSLPAHLTYYGMPDVSGIYNGLRTSDTNTDRDDHWYSYNTGNSKRQIAVHTYTHPSSSEETVNYVVLYDGSKYAPVWTAHTMNSTLYPNNTVGRNDSWASDPAISLTQQTGLDNANGVGYSRGHLVASEYRQTTVKQNKQTFYYSNQAPQWQEGFNSSATGYSGDGIWQQLENRVVAKTPSGTGKMLYVVTGVLYEGTTSTLPSGSLNVPIPSHFYKCIMECTFTGSTITSAQGIAFVYTNESHAGESYYADTYVTSINAIETRAGFDFFAGVPTSVQNTAEANANHTWFTGQPSSGSSNAISPVTPNYWGTL